MTDTAHAPKITAFGDESIATGKVVTYAAAVFETDRIGEAEAVVAAIKHEFGLAPDEHLHCRAIFSGDARAKTPWGALSREKINQLIEDLCLKMKGLQLRPLVAALDPRNVPAMPPAPGLPDRELHEKQIASLGFAAIDVQLRNTASAMRNFALTQTRLTRLEGSLLRTSRRDGPVDICQ
jgi:hypothetical protein